MTLAKQPNIGEPQLKQFFSDIASRTRFAHPPLAPSSRHHLIGRRELQRFLAAVDHRVQLAETRQQRIDKLRATGFNVFDFIEPDGNKLSDILADLLDPNGRHGQGPIFLQLLFSKLGLPIDVQDASQARVQREAPTYGILKHRRRIDVLVEAAVLLAIENKVDSLEQEHQVRDYLDHLRRCATRGRKKSVLIYLTAHGCAPGSLDEAAFDEARSAGSLRCWTYQTELREWISDCRRKCRATRIRGFLADFIAYIDSQLAREVDTADEGKADEN